MKIETKQIFAANSVAKEIGISAVRFYTYIKNNKVEPNYYHLSNGGNKFYYFDLFTVQNIKKWHSDFKKSKSRLLPDINNKKENVSEKNKQRKKRVKGRNKNGNGAYKKQEKGCKNS
jgi:hypothetical protein